MYGAIAQTSASIALLEPPAKPGQLGPARVAQDVHEEEAVLGADVAGAEDRVGARDAVDVGDAEVGRAATVQPRARAVGALDVWPAARRSSRP